MNVTFDNLYKILVLGDAAVGKTNFLIRFTENMFADNYINTIGFDYRSEIITIDEKKVKLQIWDTAGQDRYRSMTKNLYHKAQGVVLMFDVTCESSFNNIKSWLKSIKDMSGDKMTIVLVGNKIDDEKNRKVSDDEAIELAKENGLEYISASGKANINVKETFYTLAKNIMGRKLAFDSVEGKKLKNRHSDPDESKCGC